MTVPLPSYGDTDWYDWVTQIDGQGRDADAHAVDTANPHAVTKAQVGLGNVDNTADTAKPVSTAQQTALNAKAASTHTHGVADLTATGTKDTTTFLRGDNTWAVPAGGGGGGGITTEDAQDAAASLFTTATHAGIAFAYDDTANTLTGTVPSAAAANTPSLRALGTTSTTAAAGNDSRLSDARTPTAHTHGVTDLTATGTRSSSTYLRGDNTWVSLPDAWSVTDWALADLGLSAWTANPLTGGVSTGQPALGGVRLTRFKVPRSFTAATITMVITTGGATLTSGQCFAGIYSTAFARLAVTADQSANWTSTGVKAMALASSVSLTGGSEYYAAVLVNGTTAPTFNATSAGNFGTIGRTSTTYLGLSGDSGQTSLPTTVTPGGSNTLYWFGVS